MMDGRIRDTTSPGPDGMGVKKHLSVSVTHVHRTASLQINQGTVAFLNVGTLCLTDIVHHAECR
jgi:hypothetical protein